MTDRRAAVGGADEQRRLAVGRQVVDVDALLLAAVQPQEGLLHDVLGLRRAAEHPVGDREHQRWSASFGLALMFSVRGSSNAKAKRELGWTPRYANWREGFRTGLG